MTIYEADDNAIRSYLIKKYGDGKISKSVVNSVITHISIIEQIRKFKNDKDMFEAIDECSGQYIHIVR